MLIVQCPQTVAQCSTVSHHRSPIVVLFIVIPPQRGNHGNQPASFNQPGRKVAAVDAFLKEFFRVTGSWRQSRIDHVLMIFYVWMFLIMEEG